MKRVLVIFSLLYYSLSFIARGESDTKTDKFFLNYQHTSSFSSANPTYLKKFVGDTIMMDFHTSGYLDIFTIATPDTVWIKKRPQKNPVVGKHYILSYVYKGVAVNNKFMTPIEAINGKPFGVYEVKKLNNYNAACAVTLVDLETLELINFSIANSFPYNVSFTSTKTRRFINSLKSSEIYYHDPSTKFGKYSVLDGDFTFNITPAPTKSISSYYEIEPTCTLQLKSSSGDVITVYPLQYYSKSTSSKASLLTPSEYEERYTVYTLDSKINENLANSDLEMPFNFTCILGTPRDDVRMSQEISSYGLSNQGNKAPTEVMLIGGAITVRDVQYYKMLYNGKAFFMRANDVRILHPDALKLDSLLNCSEDIKNVFFNRSLIISKHIYEQSMKNAVDNYKRCEKAGLAIRQWGVYDESIYTEGTGVKMVIINPTKLGIKYIDITFQGYNAVDDPYGKLISKRCVGPVAPGEIADYQFEYIWFTDVVQYAKIRSITVTYKNGTTKNISNAQTIMLSDDNFKALISPNIVENYK